MISRAKLQDFVDRAFKKLDGLSVTVTFSNRTTTDFDFSTGQAVTSATTVYTTKGFVENITRRINDTIGTITTLTVKTGGINFNAYTEVTIDGIIYNCSILNGNEYVTTLQIVRID